MLSRGSSFLGAYGHFIRRFIVGYLLFSSAILLGLLVLDALFPKTRIYSHLKDLIRSTVPPTPPAPPAKP